MIDTPDWNDMRWILAVARAGSLSAAARRLGVSQSTMSRRIRALEDRGIRPFAPDGRPTPLGEALIALAGRMEAAHAEALAAVSGDPRPIRIAACEVTARSGALSEALRGWRGAPVALQVHDDLFALDASDYDLLVSPLDSVPETVEGVVVDEIRWGLYAAPAYLAEHPLRPGGNDLSGHRVIRASGSLARIAARRWFEGQGGAVSFLASSPAAQAEAAARGQGIALLPVPLGDADPRLRLAGPAGCAPAPIWAVAARGVADSPRIAGFLRWLRRAARAAAPLAPGAASRQDRAAGGNGEAG